jgi:hypothetical protein
MKALKILLFFLLAPIYVPAYILMTFTYKWWSGLLGD